MTVEINNITKIFGTQRAVDNVSFSIDKGQILGFLGPNGAGKSTTMKMITSYLKPDEGNIKVCGHDTVSESLLTRSNIGYLPEHNPLYTEMYVVEYLNFVANLHRIKSPQLRIKEVIDMVGLGKEQHKLIGALSKGYKQRVGLAQALIHNPEVLILDEPTSGLDMNQLQDIRKLIKDIGKEKTVIFSTHIMQEVQALCDRVIIINNGKIVADDPISNLSSRVKGEHKILLTIINDAKKVMHFDAIKHITLVKIISQDQYEITHEAGKDVRKDIFNYCATQDTPVVEMQKQVSNVEDVFQMLTKTDSAND